MNERIQEMSPQMKGAIKELEEAIGRRYPSASFQVCRGIDDPESIHLVTTVDVEDTDAVLDVVIDRVMDLQIEEGLPVHVIPVRPIERVMAMRKKADDAIRPKGFQSPPFVQP